jgi:hypothetical protein
MELILEPKLMSHKKVNQGLTVVSRKIRPTKTEAFDTYWKFASERQEIFFKRFRNDPYPWTLDEVLLKHKFTNAFRASDRVSQFLIKEVIYKGDQCTDEILFRILLFKTFNKIETWKLLVNHFGEIRFSEFSPTRYSKILSKVMESKKSIYSGAYIMTSGKSAFGYSKKHENHLRLIEFMMKDGLYLKLEQAKSMESVYNLLLIYPTIGSFLAYQYAIDINYSQITNFSELDFVMPGPGALDGIRKCFSDLGEYSESEVIKYTTEIQLDEFNRLGLEFKNLWGRDLQLIDCQNLFWEVDKYSRVIHPELSGVSGRTRIKQKFRPTSLKSMEYFFPPKWNINQNII